MLKFDEILGGLDERGCLGPCAKTRVRCEVTLTDGTVLTGENWCMEPQKACPREPGEGYEKCQTVCRQLGHAEAVVARYADEVSFEGATAVLIGHTYYCQDCQEKLFGAGVKWLGVAR